MSMSKTMAINKVNNITQISFIFIFDRMALGSRGEEQESRVSQYTNSIMIYLIHCTIHANNQCISITIGITITIDIGITIKIVLFVMSN